MIVACHFSGHGGFSFPHDTITLNRLWMQFIIMGGNLGNDIFVVLSGYFLIHSRGLSLRKLFSLWIKIFFYSVVIYALFVMSGKTYFGIKPTLKVIMPVTKSQWWFASTYFVMYLIHPYVNILLKSLSREGYMKLLLSLSLYWCIIPTLTKSDFGANPTINFLCLYSLAGYVRLHTKHFGDSKYILLGLACILMNFMSVVMLDVIGLRIQLAARGALYFLGMMRPLTILAVLCLLFGFRSLEIPHSKFINVIASATFGVYLIHDNNLVRPFLWKEVFRNASFQDSPYLIAYSLAVVIAVYVSCTLIELVRQRIFRTLSGGRLS